MENRLASTGAWVFANCLGIVHHGKMIQGVQWWQTTSQATISEPAGISASHWQLWFVKQASWRWVSDYPSMAGYVLQTVPGYHFRGAQLYWWANAVLQRDIQPNKAVCEGKPQPWRLQWTWHWEKKTTLLGMASDAVVKLCVTLEPNQNYNVSADIFFLQHHWCSSFFSGRSTCRNPA